MSEATRIVRMAVVQDLQGHVTTAGPDDHDGYDNAMEAAICWHIEAGRVPATKHWIEVELPYPRDCIPAVKAVVTHTEEVEREPDF